MQKPHPPVLIGGNGEKVIDRVVAFGDEWMPNLGLSDLDEMSRRVTELQKKAADAGRGEIPVTGSAAPREANAIERLAEIGFHRLVWYVRPEPREQVAPKVEKLARLVHEVQVA